MRKHNDGANDGHYNHMDSLERETDEDVEEEVLYNPHHKPVQLEHDGFVESLVHALESNNVVVHIDIADCMGRMHLKDYLDWETSINN